MNAVNLPCKQQSNGHHHGEPASNSVVRHSGISDILQGRPCPEHEYIHPRPSMATRPIRAVTCSGDIDESRTQFGTRTIPPAYKSVTTQSGAGATPSVDTGYLPLSSSFMQGPMLTEASQRVYSSCSPLQLHTVHHAQNNPTRQQHVHVFTLDKTGQLLLPSSRPTIWPIQHQKIVFKPAPPSTSLNQLLPAVLLQVHPYPDDRVSAALHAIQLQHNSWNDNISQFFSYQVASATTRTSAIPATI